VGGLGPTEIDEQKKVIDNFFSSLLLFCHPSNPPISTDIFISFPWLRFQGKRNISVSGGRPLLMGGLGPGPHAPPPPKSGSEATYSKCLLEAVT
jgi:hypothetical protein